MAHDTSQLLMRGMNDSPSTAVVSFTFSATLPTGAQQELGEMMAAFVALGTHGGFSLAGQPPSVSRMTLIDQSGDDRGAQFRLKTDYVDPRAFQILRGMTVRLRLDGIVVDKVLITTGDSGVHNWVIVPQPSDDNEEEVYPQISDCLPFDVVWDELGATRVRRCLVEHTRSLQANDVLAMADWVDPWFEVVEWGGFALPAFSPAEFHSLRGFVTQFDDITTEIVVFRYFGSEALWPVLLNLLAGYSETVCPVYRVTIE